MTRRPRMLDSFALADRVRAKAEVPRHQALDPEWILPRLYDISCVRLPGLTVSTLRQWLLQHGVSNPDLTVCHNRELRGGVVARRGRGLIFLDRDDPPEE